MRPRVLPFQWQNDISSVEDVNLITGDVSNIVCDKDGSTKYRNELIDVGVGASVVADHLIGICTQGSCANALL